MQADCGTITSPRFFPLLTIVLVAFFAAGCGGGSVNPLNQPGISVSQSTSTTGSDRRDFYYAASGDGYVWGFEIDASTSTLRSLSPRPGFSSASLNGVARSGNGQMLFALTGAPSASRVNLLRVDSSTGSLQVVDSYPKPGISVITADPRNGHVVGYNATDQSLVTFTFGPDGQMWEKAMIPARYDRAILDIDFHPIDDLVFLLTTRSVDTYRLDRTSGWMTLVGSYGSRIASTAQLAPDPSGEFIYVPGAGGVGITVLRVDRESGQLINTGTYGSMAGELASNPRANFVYQPVNGNILVYQLDRAAGSLTLTHVVEAREGDTSAWVDGTGTHLFVGNSTGSVAAYRIAADGSLSPVSAPLSTTAPVDRVLSVP